MFAIPWARSTVGVVLPGFIATYDLSIRQAGMVSVAIEAGTVFTMLILGFLIDRLGPGRVAAWGLPVVGIAVALATRAPSFGWLIGCLMLFGVGMALTSSGVNAVLADTGSRRSMYLGFMHGGFSMLSILTPLAAGVVLAWADWQTYYWLSAGIAFLMLVLYIKSDRFEPSARSRVGENVFSGMGGVVRRLSTLCLGVFTLAGMQGVLMTWSYLYLVNRHGAGHAVATFAASSVWTGILVGRWSIIGLHRRRSARWILITAISVSTVALTLEYLASSIAVAFVVLVIAGAGVSGAYQLGTAWASERAPSRIGAASTFIMGSAALGIGIWPWIAGVVIETLTFASLPGVVMTGFILSAVFFALTREG
jgi:fucose permease